jgi:glycine/D-amino acid oxidase-like deaminating enzyme
MSTIEVADVVVIGGGSAGLCASIAAARKGARVVLLERTGQLGGMGTLAKVHTFCGLYHPDTSQPPRIANAGLPEEIERGMRERTGVDPIRMGKVYVLPQNPSDYTALAIELIAAEPLLDVWFNCDCTGIDRRSDGSFTVHAGSRSIHCRALIDCSADAVAAPLLGATRFECPPEIAQRPATIFSLRNVDPLATQENFRLRLAFDLVRAVETGELPITAMGTACRGSTEQGEVYFTTDLEPASQRALMETGHALADRLVNFLRNRYPEYSAVEGPFHATQPGIRESYHWKGQYTLTAEDLIEGGEFPDTVAYATWPIELRETTRGPKLRFFKQPVPSPIPLRCLTSAEIPGVYFAGRCISATHEALASVRVMGTCFATGQAAGLAAAAYSGEVGGSKI